MKVSDGCAIPDTLAEMLGHASVTTAQGCAWIVDRMTENPLQHLEAVMGT